MLRYPVAIFALALALRLAYIAYAPPIVFGDLAELSRLGCSLASGQGYTGLHGDPTAYFPPGYPAFLAAIYAVTGCDELVAVAVVQAVLGALTCVLICLVARRFVSRGWAAALACVWACLPFTIKQVRIHDAALYSFLVALAMVIAVEMIHGDDSSRRRYLWIAALGLVVGFATLIKPAIIAVPLSALIYAAWRRGGVNWQPYVAALGVAAIVVCSWTTANWVRLDAFVPLSTNSGIVLWIGSSGLIREHKSVVVFESPSYHLHWAATGRPIRMIPDGDIEWRNHLAPSLEYELAQNERATRAALGHMADPWLRARSAWDNVIYLHDLDWSYRWEPLHANLMDHIIARLLSIGIVVSYALGFRLLIRGRAGPAAHLYLVCGLWVGFYALVAHGVGTYVEPMMWILWLIGLAGGLDFARTLRPDKNGL